MTIDLDMKRVVLHDDNVAAVETGTTISVRYDEAAPLLRNVDVGEIRCVFKGWMPKATEVALAESTSLMREIICEAFLSQPEMAKWEGEEERVRVGMASQCIYLIISKPSKHKMDLTPLAVEKMVASINASQKLFELGAGHVTFGSPEGGTLQFSYKLLEA